MSQTKTPKRRTKSGSSGTPKSSAPVKDDGSFDLASVPRHRGPGKGGASLQEHPAIKLKAQRDKMGLAPVPSEAAAAPVEWAEKHIESLAPDAAKEVEWALKFGSDTHRYIASRDILAMKGIMAKPKESGAVQQAMVFQFNGPVSPSGAPILPFSNALSLAAQRPTEHLSPAVAAAPPTTAPATPSDSAAVDKAPTDAHTVTTTDDGATK